MEIEELAKLNLEQLYNTFIYLPETTEIRTNEYQRAYSQATYGIKHIFPIQKIIDDYYTRKHKINQVIIQGYGQLHETDFEQELQERKRLMVKIIYKYTQEIGVGHERTTLKTKDKPFNPDQYINNALKE